MRIALLLLALPLAGWAQEWPQFRGNAPMTGVASAALNPPLKQVWSWEGAEGIDSSPSIAGGAVYFGTQEGDLVSLDFATGKLRWKYKANEGIGESSPAVADGTVYVGDLTGVVHAVKAADGKGIWTFKTGAEVKASPVVAEGKVLVGSYDGVLYALDAANGQVGLGGEDGRPGSFKRVGRERRCLHRGMRRALERSAGSRMAKRC